jgi:hypothetical protein
MIDQGAIDHIAARAYIPEHLPGYVCSVSRAEPFVVGEHLCYVREDHLAFIGYPLSGGAGGEEMEEALREALSRFRPKRLSLISQEIPTYLEEGLVIQAGPLEEGKGRDGGLKRGRPPRRSRKVELRPRAMEVRDWYYRLELSRLRIPSKTINMVRRASREARVVEGGSPGEEHEALIRSFLASRSLDAGTAEILGRVPDYLRHVSTARLYSAFDGEGRLVAFDVAEFGAKEYAFYMFNFRSRDPHVPGASDLLLHEIIKDAARAGKSFLNLGLGVSPGVAFFKEKWGATRFLPYRFRRYGTKSVGILDLLTGTGMR